jgi:2-oxoglutarate dehydrogenase E2 component (dihydrolipoamide succinyltransferase)
MSDILAPTLGESVSEATVARWTKKPGEAVKKDEVLVELETDKVSLEVSAPSDGVLGEIAAAEGDTVVAGQKLGDVVENGAAKPASKPAAKPAAAPAAPVAAAPAPAAVAPTAGVVDVKTPTMGESVSEGTIATWSKKVGDKVAKDDVLVEIETDKVAVEVSSPVDGTLSEILVENGGSVKPGQVIARVAGGASAAAVPQSPSAAPAAAPKAAVPSAIPLSPSVQRIAAETGIDTAGISGTGKDGRITKGDALAAVDAKASAPVSVAAAPVAPSAPRPPQEREERVKMTRLRQTIAKRLKDAQNTAAMLTTFNEVDMTNVMALRNQYKDIFEKKHGVKLGFMSFFTRACIAALKEVPDVNAEIDGGDIIYKNHYDIGVAVGTDKGLVVPVVRDADAMSLAEIEKAIGALGKKARDGKLAIEDMQGGTFTITNGGVYGSLMSTPILNAPQSGVLGMHNIVQRPMAVNGQVLIRPMMYLALSYDHRVVDGKGAVTFLVSVKNAIEDPQRLLLDL